MSTPEEIEKIISPKDFGSNNHRSRNSKVTSVILIVLIILSLVGGGIYAFIKLKPSLGIKTTSNVEIQNKGDYLLYQPTSFNDSAVKRLVFVISPGGTDQEARGMISQWSSVADQYGYLLASMPDWSRDSIISYLRDAKRIEGVAKIYISGFSNGGYNSCAIGLALPSVVDGIIPMGAYCSKFDVKLPDSKFVPILTVIGSQDTLALGDDGQQPYGYEDDLTVKFIIVPNIGHAFPTSVMGDIADWISKN